MLSILIGGGLGGVIAALLGVPLLAVLRKRNGYTPLVEPTPDAFLVQYRSPYVPSPIAGYVNGRPYRLDNDGNPIYGYQPLLNRPPNPALDIVYNKSGKPPQVDIDAVMVSLAVVSDVKQEHEAEVGDCEVGYE